MPDELLFTVRGSTATPAQPLSLAEAGLRERRDLQEWVIAHPEILGPDIMIVTMEFDRWQSAAGKGADRLDVLGLHTSGELVVAELKRDRAPDTIEMQAIKYAAMVSRFSAETLSEQHAKYLTDRKTPTTAEEAADLLARHADITPESVRRPRLVLLASEFPPTTLATAVWLREMLIDITLMQYRAYRTGREISISVSQLYPVRNVEEFEISPRQAEVRAAVATRQRRQDVGTVAKIIEAGSLEEGAPLTARPYGVNPDLREKIEAWLDGDPKRRQARWQNDERRPIVWEADDQGYTPTTVAKTILREATGLDRALRGGEWWIDSEGRDLVEIAGEQRDEPWNGTDYYVSIGEGETRRWADMVRYGFVSAGGGRWYSRTLSILGPGARIFACIPNVGYVGVGIVSEPAVPIGDFAVHIGGSGDIGILQAPLEAPAMAEGAADLEACEYLVRVKWLATVPKDRAIWQKGMFANQNSACKLRSSFTIGRVSEELNIADETARTNDGDH